jgi:3-methyl-2-oxobutanoate hydroxymethyltransferase
MKKNLACLVEKKKNRQKITMISCYDYPTSLRAEEAGIDVILVGDSVGTRMLGYQSPNQVTLPDMLHHFRAVRRAVKSSFLLADLPVSSVETPARALHDARIFLDYGADGVKLEVFETETVSLLAREGIEVCVDLIFPLLVKRNAGKPAQDLFVEYIRNAEIQEKAGASLVVFTMAPEEIARLGTERIHVPTIGVGSGRYTDGQVLIAAEMLGISEVNGYYNREYDRFGERTLRVMQQFVTEVTTLAFPAEENCRHIGDKELNTVRDLLAQG